MPHRARGDDRGHARVAERPQRWFSAGVGRPDRLAAGIGLAVAPIAALVLLQGAGLLAIITRGSRRPASAWLAQRQIGGQTGDVGATEPDRPSRLPGGPHPGDIDSPRYRRGIAAATVTAGGGFGCAGDGHQGRIYGQADFPAIARTRRSSSAGGGSACDAVWITSNLRRTHQTAEAILAAMPRAEAGAAAGIARPAERLIEPEIAEQHFGDWQGRTFDELYKMRGDERFTFWISPASEVPPGGESFVEVVSRVGGAVRRLTEQFAGRQIVAIAHGGSIRAALAHALAIDANGCCPFHRQLLGDPARPHLRPRQRRSGQAGLARQYRQPDAPSAFRALGRVAAELP
jgi:broad specificity phosphatase PhoE